MKDNKGKNIKPDSLSGNDIALIYFHSHNLPLSLEYINKANLIRNKNLEPNHPSLALGYNHLSNINRANNDLKEALLASKKSLEILEAILPKEHNNLGMGYNHTAFAYFSMGIKFQALTNIKFAIAIWDKVYPNGHPSLEYAMKLFNLCK